MIPDKMIRGHLSLGWFSMISEDPKRDDLRWFQYHMGPDDPHAIWGFSLGSCRPLCPIEKTRFVVYFGREFPTILNVSGIVLPNCAVANRAVFTDRPDQYQYQNQYLYRYQCQHITKTNNHTDLGCCPRVICFVDIFCKLFEVSN